MSKQRWADLDGTDTVTEVIVATPAEVAALPSPEDWIPCPKQVQVDWTFTGGDWFDPAGNPLKKTIAPEKFILTPDEWVLRFTNTEWAWLKTERASDDGLDRIMDAIDKMVAIPLRSPPLDLFYFLLLGLSFPGGLPRIEALRAPKE